MTVDRHTLALISIVGSALDVLGALYLAYDLLGGEHGPLRTLTRAVTYAVLFGTGYGLAMGPVFGVVTGLAHGITLGWEFSRASRNEPESGFWLITAVSAIRGVGFALGTAWLFGARFGIAFGYAGQIPKLCWHMRCSSERNHRRRTRLAQHVDSRRTCWRPLQDLSSIFGPRHHLHNNVM